MRPVFFALSVAALMVVSVPARAEAPAQIAVTDEKHESLPQAAVEIPLPESLYSTFPLDAGMGCLWRLPPAQTDELEAYAALALVRHNDKEELSLQVAGAVTENMVVQAASFASIQLTTGTFNSDDMALAKEAGGTARVILPPAALAGIVTALGEGGGALAIALEDGESVSFALPPVPEDDLKKIRDCIAAMKNGQKDKQP